MYVMTVITAAALFRPLGALLAAMLLARWLHDDIVNHRRVACHHLDGRSDQHRRPACKVGNPHRSPPRK